MKESEIQREILEILYKIPNSIVLRNNNSPIYDPKTDRFRKLNRRFQPYGVPDIFFFYDKKTYGIEVKTPKEYKYLINNFDEIKNGFYSHKSTNSTEKKKARMQAQILFLERMESVGHIGFFTCNARECLLKIKL